MLAAIAVVALALLGGAVLVQMTAHVEPCPMCIVQRYAVIGVALCAGIGALMPRRGAQVTATGLVVLVAAFGAFTAARQSWLQWHPPEFASCGRDFYGMIANFPLQRVIPMIFRGSGDCSQVDWTFLGGSLANWSFVWFCLFLLAAIVLFARQLRRRERGPASAPVAA